MNGRVVEAEFCWSDEPQRPVVGWFAINCAEFPRFLDRFITFYFDSEDEFEKARNNFKNDFRIVRVLED